MKRRLGNDIPLVVIPKQNGQTVDLSDAINIKVYVRHQLLGTMQEQEFEVVNNTIQFQFIASEQRNIGVYDIVVEWQKADSSIEGGIASFKYDVCNAFELVSRSCTLTEEEQQPEDLILEIAEALRGKEGKSAYQTWLDSGNTGTEEDFIISLRNGTVIYGQGRPDKPETTNGKITGNEPIGTQFNSSDGANVGAWIWAKRSDGWVAVHGDTNMVVLTSQSLSDGKLVFRRLNSLVTFGIGYQGQFGTFSISQNPIVKDGNKIVLGTVPLGFCSTTIPQLAMVTDDGKRVYEDVILNVLIRQDQAQIQLRFKDAATLNSFKGKTLLRVPIMSWSTNETWTEQI